MPARLELARGSLPVAYKTTAFNRSAKARVCDDILVQVMIIRTWEATILQSHRLGNGCFIQLNYKCQDSLSLGTIASSRGRICIFSVRSRVLYPVKLWMLAINDCQHRSCARLYILSKYIILFSIFLIQNQKNQKFAHCV